MEFNATFFVSAISFIVFTLIMNKIFYKPLAKIMEERQKFIDAAVSDAKYSNDKADEILKDRDEKLNSSLVKSRQIIADMTNSANKNADNIIKDAKSNAQKTISDKKSDLQMQADELDKNLEPEIIKLANVISDKLLGFEVKAGE
ncbi:F0F1 ATP synthase subunit B [bacterium]|nr:F0F1 ATP synthase subunit B [bacterium]